MNKVHNKYHGTAPPGAVYIGRGSPYGNPFVIGQDGNRNQVCDKFRDYLEMDRELLKRVKRDLRGKDLVCFCKPRRCHGDLLLEIANK
jgi:hypothetical protein